MQEGLYTEKLQKYAIASVAVGIGLCVGGAQIGGPTWIGVLIRDLGIALLVGVYLMYTIERLNALRTRAEIQRYMKVVGDNFIKAVYGNDLPQGLFQEVKSSIFDVGCLRSGYSIDLTFHDFTDAYVATSPPNVRPLLEDFRRRLPSQATPLGPLVVLRLSTHYEVHNVGPKTSDQAVAFEMPKPFAGNYPGLCSITSVVINGHQELAAPLLDTPQELGIVDPTKVVFRKQISIPARKPARVGFEAYTIKSADSWEQWQILVPCHGVSVTATDADGNKDVFVSLDAGPHEGVEAFVRKDPRTNKASLSTSQYLLPYQGFTVTWTPTRAADRSETSLHE
jgi:hypothetical protein